MAEQLHIFHNQAAQSIAEQLGAELGVAPGKQTVKHFADGEIMVSIEEDVHHQDVLVIATTHPPAEHWIETLLLLDTLRQAKARSLTLLLPYTGYNRQDESTHYKAHSARVHLQSLSRYTDRIIAVDLHAETSKQYCGDIPMTHISCVDVFGSHLQSLLPKTDYVFAAPDQGGLRRARQFADYFTQPDLISLAKTRSDANLVSHSTVPDKVTLSGKTVILIDDMVDTGGTLIAGAKAAKEAGAAAVWAVATHGLFSQDAVAHIERSPIDHLFVSNSIGWVSEKVAGFTKTAVSVVPIAPALTIALKHETGIAV